MKPSDLPPIVTSAQMRGIDEYAISKLSIPGLTLMENAGAGIAAAITKRLLLGNLREWRVAILCGPGNNGGDGYVIARQLDGAGVTVSLYSTSPPSQLKGDAKVNADRAQAAGIGARIVDERDDAIDLSGNDFIVDAIFGTGFHGQVTGIAASLIRAANQSDIPIVAVDTPSGLDNDTGELSSPTIRAKHTFALGATKLGQWLWPGRANVGCLEVVDIGIPKEAYASQELSLRLLNESFVRASLPARPPDAHKGTIGKALIVGGSAGMSGAVVLAANACMRSGVGLTYAAVPESLVDAVDVGAIETVVRSLPEVGGKRVIARRAIGEIVRLWADSDAVAIGPGLSTHHETQELARRLISRREKPTVLDADGLNACAKDVSCFESEGAALIITPHAGEMARLFDRPIGEITADRQAAALEAARRFHCIVVMKGAPTFVADDAGHLYLNPTGNSGMASGGVGDVLTGMIVSFLAQGCEPLIAAILGVYLHGLAGDTAMESIGGRSLVASDLVDHLPTALHDICDQSPAS